MVRARTCSCTASCRVEPARKRDSLEYRFNVQSNGKVVRAYYTGIVPDTFKDESEVVLKGTPRVRRHVPRGQGRRDGQVPVEVRPGEAAGSDVRRALPSTGTK